SAQRLPNGNTLITEGGDGRFLEVTKDCDIVWEYISPYVDPKFNHNQVYRAYRIPYDWVPQLDSPREKAIARLDNSKFRVDDSGTKRATVATLKRGGRVNTDPSLCVIPTP
ncbi:MAG TPA: thioredoxin, partial [Candidatus Latescibacteria bacterium]|nr:thioredoxin [Candidatus Latescibacterota bacterium]